MYGPVEGEAFSGVTGVIETGGIGNITAFDGATFTAKWLERGHTLAELEQHDGTLSSEIHVLKTTESENFSVRLRYGFYYVAYDVEPADLPSWGFTYVSTNDGDDVVTLTHQYSPSGTYTTAKVAKFYGPVNGVTTQASRVYAPVKDATLDPYIREGGAGNIISVDADKLLFHIPPSRKQKDIAYIKFTAYPSMNGYKLEVYHTDSTSQYLLTAAALLPREIYNILGVQMKAPTVNIAVDYIDFPVGYKNRFKTKIVHQAFGHVDYGYGSVEYYTDSSHTTKTIGKLRSTSEVNSLAGSTSSWTATVDGQSVSNSDIISVELNRKVSTVPTYFLSGCTSLNNVDIHFANILNLGDYFLSGCSNFNGTIVLPYKLLNIGDQFLQGCSAFNQVLSFPESVRSIGDNFLSNCSSYNKALALPGSLVSIGRWFLYQCRSFNQNLSLPSSLISIGTAFISMNIPESGKGAMTGTIDVGSLPATIIASSNFSFACISSSAPMYTTGITISGSTRADWMTKFPNGNNSGLRRKLVDAGY